MTSFLADRGLTRRAAMSGALAVPFVVAAGSAKALSAPTYAVRFEAWLSEEVRSAPAANLSLRRFEESGTSMSAVLGLDWGPGQRQWRLSADGESTEATFRALKLAFWDEAQATGIFVQRAQQVVQ